MSLAFERFTKYKRLQFLAVFHEEWFLSLSLQREGFYFSGSLAGLS
ncbi:hypothetical protein KVL79_05845 [Helicobacter pylori]|nr:hypothetical protein KVL79_05845 [Helicobacter pylori]